MLRWRKVATVIRREYLARVKTKAFWISTALVPLFMVVMMVAPTMLMKRAGGRFNVALVAGNEKIVKDVTGEVERQTKSKERAGDLVISLRVEKPAADAAAQRAQLKREVLAKRLNAVLIIHDDVLTTGKAEYLSNNLTAIGLITRLENAVQEAVVRERLIGAGVAPERTAELIRGIDLQTIQLGKGGEEGAGSFVQSFYLSWIFMFIIWFTMMIYGMYVMRGVIEEKSSRIVEVIVANLRPYELMVGKIFGIGAVGLTQYAIWVLVAMNFAIPGLIGLSLGMGNAPGLSPVVLAFFLLFFLLGYILYSTFYAAMGAAFNSEEEAQQMQGVLSMIMALPFVLMMPVMNNPDSTLSVVLSLIPPFTPVLFFLRMTIQMPPAWQIALALVLLLATIFFVARVAAAVYRVGILMYGKKPSLREIAQWARSS
jgi:ABC-2 type transport system permease protein